jgi:type I restriction enzyme S subunit
MKLGEILKIYRVETRVKDEIEYKQVTISQHTGVKYRGKKLGISIGRKRQFIVDLVKYPNTVMFTRQGLKDGAIGFASKEVHNCIVTENMPTLSVNTDKVDVRYLERLLNSNYFLKKISELTIVGSAQKSIHERDLLKLEINIPDLETQKIIAEKIISKEGNYYSLTNEIQTQKQLLTKLKQAILQEAIQGKLTQDWRTRHPELVEGQHSAEHLLQRIKAEKAQLIKEGKIKKEKPLPKITQEEIPFEIPKGWVWCRLGEVTTYGSSEKIDSQKIKDNTWVLDLEDIEKESSKILQFKTFSERPSLSRKSVFKKGWVLYSKLRPYLDKVVVVPKDGVCTTEILPLPIYGNMNAYFLMYTLKGKHFLNYVNSKVGGMKMPRLGTDDGKMALIPLAPIEEQKEIVKKVESLKQKCTALEQEVTQSETNAQMLMQAVLKEAFEG